LNAAGGQPSTDRCTANGMQRSALNDSLLMPAGYNNHLRFNKPVEAMLT
jgi:hypothetical protein